MRSAAPLVLALGLGACGSIDDAPPDNGAHAPEVTSDRAGPPDGVPADAVRIAAADGLWMSRHEDDRWLTVRLFTPTGADVLTDAGQPPIPRLDVARSASPAQATCTQDGDIRLLLAVTHKPPGIVASWDIYETVYVVEGAVARGETVKLHVHVLDPDLSRRFPGLIGREMFVDCVVRPG